MDSNCFAWKAIRNVFKPDVELFIFQKSSERKKYAFTGLFMENRWFKD